MKLFHLFFKTIRVNVSSSVLYYFMNLMIVFQVIFYIFLDTTCAKGRCSLFSLKNHILIQLVCTKNILFGAPFGTAIAHFCPKAAAFENSAEGTKAW